MQLNPIQRQQFKDVMKPYKYSSSFWLQDNMKYDVDFVDIKEFMFNVFKIHGNMYSIYTKPVDIINQITVMYGYGKRKGIVTQERRDKLKKLFKKLCEENI